MEDELSIAELADEELRDLPCRSLHLRRSRLGNAVGQFGSSAWLQVLDVAYRLGWTELRVTVSNEPLHRATCAVTAVASPM